MRGSALSRTLRAEQVAETAARTPEENVLASLALAEIAIELHRARTGEGRAGAVRAIERQHQLGRRPSKVMAR